MRQWIIIMLAIVLVVILNIWQENYLNITSRYILTDINEIANSVERQDYEYVLKGIEELEKNWMKIKDNWDIFGEHNDIEEIEEHIINMKIYAKYENKEELVKEYTLLENVLKSVIETEKIKFSNVL